MAEWAMLLDDILGLVLEQVKPQDVASMRSGLTHLHLCFHAHHSITAHTLQPLQQLRRLQTLVLENKARAQPTLMGLGHLGSQQIALDQLHVKAFVVGLDSGIDSMSALRSLHLSNCILMMVRAKGQGFPVMLTGLRQLELLACKGCSGLSSRPFAGIESLVSLKTCLLNCSLRMSDDTCADIASLRQVQTLGLACSALEGCLTPACITHAGLRSLCGMTQLTALDLSGHAAISDASMAEIARHLTRLIDLDLRRPACDNPGAAVVTDAGIAALASLTLLESVRLSQAQVGQAGCAALASLPRLRCLELSYCDSLSDTPVCELTRLRHLSELSLAGCASVTDIAVTALVRGMPELMRLDLSACHMHVGDISLYAIATLPNLQVLRLHSCERVSDMGIGGLCSGAAAAALTHLDVRGCERISDAGATSIGRCLKQLQYLSLEHCHLIGDRGIRTLSGLPHLEILRVGGTGATTDSFAQDFTRRVRLESPSNTRIWWMLDS
ncbi:RNI-like protein [Coccomyxa subellipsoidea C-169]|uniref:RNI-like protein n=1 Tax=Coccomyxa subellipsoidea (strain C-169) TaxID=574566 RepID=I0Z260_COCSC|nr:RNI-like protein [Coccomyxa subellipsoidea C-169]EIE24729.1 RNI-like protein [Coccomyxa subellipsoidea C-169]|eukprot:XP_005649273.1 RNI-like protein [Coccomyxa subellipsoidea C-169]